MYSLKFNISKLQCTKSVKDVKSDYVKNNTVFNLE